VAHEPTPTDENPQFITIPAAAREELGQLVFYLGQALMSLHEVNAQVQGSAEPMPRVLNDLREIVTMTEVATVKVLAETEALVAEGQAAAALIDEARRQAADAGLAEILGRLSTLLATSNKRATTIMAALEFQDLTAQKIQRADTILEDIQGRLEKVQALVDTGLPVESEPRKEPRPIDVNLDSATAQAVADQLVSRFGQ
jgi:chemotaxis regulatin CheY-phosphate phosphatase CheZ